jgi:RimJ/RimL family protein N-acetyltransferase
MRFTSVGIKRELPTLQFGRVELRPLEKLDPAAWKRLHHHFRDPEIAHLNGTPPNRMPLWLLRSMLRADAARYDRRTFGIFDEARSYIGTIELYDLRAEDATLGIIIGERTHWGRGYGREAMSAILVYAFGPLELQQVRLHTFGDNERAQRAFRNIGFQEVRRVTAQSGRTDVHMLIQRRTWERLKEPQASSDGS